MDASVFLGAFLGFLAGIGVQFVVTVWRRRERGILHRNHMAVELLDNLDTIESILDAVEETEMGGFQVAKTTIARPRAEVLRSIAINGEALLSLSAGEGTGVVQLVGHLDRLLKEYEDWPQAIGGASGLLQLQLPDGSVRPAREIVTEQLRSTLRTVMMNQMGILVVLLNSSSERGLVPRRPLRAIKRALKPTRTRWWSSKAIAVAMTPPNDEDATDEQRSRPLVVWERGSSDYTGPVIELKPLVDERERAP